jgi:hypothetical protein
MNWTNLRHPNGSGLFHAQSGFEAQHCICQLYTNKKIIVALQFGASPKLGALQFPCFLFSLFFKSGGKNTLFVILLVMRK